MGNLMTPVRGPAQTLKQWIKKVNRLPFWEIKWSKLNYSKHPSKDAKRYRLQWAMFFVGHLMIHDDSTLLQQKRWATVRATLFFQGEKLPFFLRQTQKKTVPPRSIDGPKSSNLRVFFCCFSSFSLSKYLGRNKLLDTLHLLGALKKGTMF